MLVPPLARVSNIEIGEVPSYRLVWADPYCGNAARVDRVPLKSKTADTHKESPGYAGAFKEKPCRLGIKVP